MVWIFQDTGRDFFNPGLELRIAEAEELVLDYYCHVQFIIDSETVRVSALLR